MSINESFHERNLTDKTRPSDSSSVDVTTRIQRMRARGFLQSIPLKINF